MKRTKVNYAVAVDAANHKQMLTVHQAVLQERDELKAQVKQLKYELTLSTDQNDLLLDEFVRVKLLTKNKEIHQLCERAHVRMRQRVSVIDRNFKQAQEIKELKAQIEKLINPAKEAAEALGFTSHHLRGRASENMLMDMAEKADALISAIRQADKGGE